MRVHQEIAFEDDICAHLAAHGWLYEPGDAQRYDRARALFPPDLIAWVRETQPSAWESLTKTHGAAAETVLLDRIRTQLDDRGTLDLLRHGVELLGLRKPLQLAQFKPALAMNPALEARYQANRLRVVRQVHYSLHHENSLDLTLFLNGLPVGTGELKTDFTQCLADAVDQYRFDRDPKPKGQGQPEPLLSFPGGALIHFAISNAQVAMTTRLQGPETRFLPFERTAGVVAVITRDSGSKSGELARALAGGKKIVVCTIQTFPFAIAAVRELAATQGKRFAVIVDEAHSSQTGEAAAKLREVLSAQELAELADGGELSTEDLLTAQMTARAGAGAAAAGITYIAFTATPKAKTLELFGRRPDPVRPPGPDNLPAAFHVYSMRQAIEEGFILDVLRNYTPYRLAFRLAAFGRERDARDVIRDEALKGVLRWVRLHPYNIAQKVQVVVEHFRETIAPLLDGQAKAMVVVGSRVEAVRWQLAMTRYIRDQGYAIGALVAFSGEVSDPESGADPFTERSAALNPALRGRDLREAFATDAYHLLLVANKFQTGFDQPLLCGMYVDKRLAGIQAVQTLSRLNRAHPGKDTTYILDFVNEPDDILTAFKPYYETAALAGVTDPNLVYDLRARLDAAGYYDDFEIARVVAVELDPRATQRQLIAALEPVADRLLRRFKAEREALDAAKDKADTVAAQAAQDAMNALFLFKRNLGAFLRVYAFLSQIFDYGNTAIEQRALFYKRLLPLLDFGRAREGVDLSKLRLTHHGLHDQGKRHLPLTGGERLAPLTQAGSGDVREQARARLAEIIAAVNDLFEGALTDDDKLVYVNNVLKGKLLESETLVQQARSNTKEQFATSPDLANALLNAIIDACAAHGAMSKQALDSERVRRGLQDILLGPGQLWEALREHDDGPRPVEGRC